MVQRWWYHPKQIRKAHQRACYQHFGEVDASKVSKEAKIGFKRHSYIKPFKAINTQRPIHTWL